MINETDILISRVVDGRNSSSDWARFETLANSKADLWKDLAIAQRDDAQLRTEMAAAVSLADRVGLPETTTQLAADSLKQPGSLHSRTLRISAWAGWAAAALVALAFLGPARTQWINRSASPIQTAGFDPFAAAEKLSTDQLRDLYLAKGQREGSVIGETPSWVLKRIEQDENGGMFAVVVRQIVERQPVQDIRRPAIDESGRPVSVPAITNTSFRPPM
jgi:hypothetical protein